MVRHFVMALVAALLWSAGQSLALTLTNRDTDAQRVLITETAGDKPVQEFVIAEGETLEGICEQGCTITLENGDEDIFGGTEDVYLENGQILISE